MDYELFLQQYQASQNMLGALTYLFDRIRAIMKKQGRLQGIRQFLQWGGLPTNQSTVDLHTFK